MKPPSQPTPLKNTKPPSAQPLKKHFTHLSFWNIEEQLDPTVWLQLFMEFKGAEIAKQEGLNLKGVYQVKETLDLEKEATTYNYIRWFAVHEMKRKINI